MAVRIGAVSRRTITYACTVRRGDLLIGQGQLTAACVTRLADGAMASADLPSGLVARLQAAMAPSGPFTE